ncbi:BglG family transcription antiterminator [Shouchella clausii]
MNVRTKEILKNLLAATSPITGSQLATIIQVTSRTIRNDIKQLNEELKNRGAFIVSLKGKGYQLRIEEENLFKQLLKEMMDKEEEGLPVELEDRVRYLVKILLVQESYVKVDDIADGLFISRSTLQKNLRDVKVILSKYNLFLDNKPNFGVKILGEELQIRFCMAEYMFDRNNEFIEINDSLSSLLPLNEILVIRKSILDNIKNDNISLSDISLKNLIIHIAIACKRVRKANYIQMVESDFEDISKQKEFKIANKIIEVVEKKLYVRFPKNEVAYITMHLLGTRLLITPSIEKEKLNKYINKSILQLAHAMIKDVESKLSLGIVNDKELLAALTLHLKPAISRYRYGMNLRNPMIAAIKINYPFAFEAAVIAGRTIEREMNIKIDENELGYLALHFGAAMERRGLTSKLKKCLIVCATGVGSAQLLYYKLSTLFEKELKIVGTSEYYNLNNHSLQDIDLVISTVPIPDDIGVPSIQVSTILGRSDIEKIRNKIKKSSELVDKYIREKYVFLQKDFSNKEEVIHFLCRKLIDDQLVREEYVESVLKREAASPTSFGNLVAIPHPMTPHTDTTFWMVCTLKKAINWEGEQVQLIVLLNIGNKNSDDLKQMYERLVMIVDDVNTVQKLIQCESPNQLLTIMYSKI